ncbi:hypothetical protein BJ138DRAFT_1101119 [Hygrophoropsis aurantiaca]|uniref:Uncharacterized protein n=1 Tax=Hygrophoropsis aurantiaca TaxID=72124 RepID=A0ACB8ADJ1_9AGAM|nr:hypothetical protein BJ138DRAFT_1101119 [Hygrophoropsis aurantiaca]
MAKTKTGLKKNVRVNALGRSMTKLQNDLHQQQSKFHFMMTSYITILSESWLGKDRAKDRSRKYDQHQHDRHIPRPYGRAGRSTPNGYSLIDELGLSNNKPRYNAICDNIRALVFKYLDPALTINHQSKILVEKVILKLWPIRDLMGQFLRNRVAFVLKKAREKVGFKISVYSYL